MLRRGDFILRRCMYPVADGEGESGKDRVCAGSLNMGIASRYTGRIISASSYTGRIIELRRTGRREDDRTSAYRETAR